MNVSSNSRRYFILFLVISVCFSAGIVFAFSISSFIVIPTVNTSTPTSTTVLPTGAPSSSTESPTVNTVSPVNSLVYPGNVSPSTQTTVTPSTVTLIGVIGGYAPSTSSTVTPVATTLTGTASSFPSIILNPTSGPIGTLVTVTGTSYPASSTVSITYDGTAVTTTPTTITTTASGGFSATFTVPSSTITVHSVIASSGAIAASATFTVTSSTLHSTTTAITPNPSQVAASSSIKYNATITDTSATPNAPTGSVTFSDGGKGGSFTACNLATGTGKSTCSTTYTSPSIAGPETINGTYPGDTTHQKSSGTSALTVGTSAFPIIVMNDTTTSFDSLISSSRPFIGEYVSPTSVLIGKPIDSITLRMAKVGAPTGTAQVGIFDINRNVVKLFATVDVSTIATTDTVYEFKLPATDHYTIASGDRIGIKYTGGSSSVGVNVTPDRVTGDPFDGTNSYRVRYETAWITSSSEDMYMILKQTHG